MRNSLHYYCGVSRHYYLHGWSGPHVWWLWLGALVFLPLMPSGTKVLRVDIVYSPWLEVCHVWEVEVWEVEVSQSGTSGFCLAMLVI